MPRAKSKLLTGPSEYQAAADPEKYRVPDHCCACCSEHTDAAVSCVNAGKNGRNGRSAAVGATVFWLTCPALNNLVARWERAGAVQRLSQWMNSAPQASFLQAHVDSHALFLKVVSTYMSEDQMQFFTTHFVTNADENRRKFGNAAVSHASDLKCLHALVGQSLGGAFNPLGNAILRYIAKVHDDILGEHSSVIAPTGTRATDEEESTEKSEEAAVSAAGQRNEAVCAVLDDVERLVEFLTAFDDPRALYTAESLDGILKQKAKTEGEGTSERTTWDVTALCRAASELLLAAEGHAPRARKKHRKN